MAMIDTGRGRAAPDASPRGRYTLMSAHLPALLEENLFIVTADDDALLAIDTAGLLVVVRIEHRLDGESLLAALAVAGRASRLTRAQLGERYAAGSERFAKDLMDFFDAVPVTRVPRTGTGDVRLAVVCSEEAPDVEDVLVFLDAPGSQVQVVLADVPAPDPEPDPDVELDLEPAPAPVLVPEAGGMPAAGPVRTSAFGTPELPAVPRPPSSDELTTVLPPVSSSSYPVYSEPPQELLDPPSRPQAARPAGSAYTPVFLSVPEALENLPERPAGIPSYLAEPSPSLDLVVAPDPDSGYQPGPEAPAQAGTGLTGRRAYRASAFIAAKKYMPEKLDRPTPGPVPPPPTDAPLPSAETPVVGPVDPDLTELASALYDALPLVWVRHRRGERYEALLHPDGVLETSDGLRYADPTWAATGVSGAQAPDGWRVWRAGEDGPSLEELLG